jgi:hypothetical protein
MCANHRERKITNVKSQNEIDESAENRWTISVRQAR